MLLSFQRPRAPSLGGDSSRAALSRPSPSGQWMIARLRGGSTPGRRPAHAPQRREQCSTPSRLGRVAPLSRPQPPEAGARPPAAHGRPAAAAAPASSSGPAPSSLHAALRDARAAPGRARPAERRRTMHLAEGAPCAPSARRNSDLLDVLGQLARRRSAGRSRSLGALCGRRVPHSSPTRRRARARLALRAHPSPGAGSPARSSYQPSSASSGRLIVLPYSPPGAR